MTEVPLGAVGRAWIRRSLDTGGELAAAVLRSVILDRGTCWADVPDPIPPSTSLDRLEFAPAPGGSREQFATFAQRTERLMRAGMALVVEDELWRQGDRVFPVPEGTRLVVGSNQVFTLRQGETADVAGFVKRHSAGFPTNCFFLEWPGRSANDISASALLERIGSVQSLACTAWDAEGFVWWRPGEAIP